MKKREAMLNASGKRFAIVASRFNEQIVQSLTEGCENCLLKHGTAAGDITVFYVPGAFEIPLAAQKIARGDTGENYDAIIALGAIIRGDTAHFDYVAGQVASGIARVALDSSLPVIFAVLTTETLEQAQNRAGAKSGNKGWDAAVAAIEMASFNKNEFIT